MSQQYKPPKITKFSDYERGLVVQCPAERKRSDGHVTINKNDPLVYRTICLVNHYDTCRRCPNGAFEMVLENIGPPEDFKWMDDVIRLICKAIDARVSKSSRAHGDTSLENHDCIVCEHELDLEPSSVMDKESATLIGDMIEKAAHQRGVKHKVLAVNILNYGRGFRVTTSLRRK